MVLVLRKGASRGEIQKIEKRLQVVRVNDISKYFGKIKLKENPLSIQKEMRNEWQ